MGRGSVSLAYFAFMISSLGVLFRFRNGPARLYVWYMHVQKKKCCIHKRKEGEAVIYTVEDCAERVKLSINGKCIAQA